MAADISVLTNPNAQKDTVKLYTFLCSLSGKGILSGQQECPRDMTRGNEAFRKLWCIMYDRFTNLHKLNNLIWVLGYSGEMKDGWYPVDDVVDCIGGDAYSEGIHEDLYNFVTKQTTKSMPVCHHENGPIPEPGLLALKQINWCWFLTWHTMHIHEQNSASYINYVYNHPYVITLETLPQIYK